MPEFIFWASLLLLVYTWVGYPLLVALLSRLMPLAGELLRENTEQFTVSVIIAAHNEEGVIEKRIQNILRQRPSPLVKEIIVGSDGSTDDTVLRARSIQSSLVRVLDFPEKRGRAAVHNDCAAAARGEILVFTDAETEFAKSFLNEIVRPFGDSSVGCVVGQLRWKNKGETPETSSQGLYWRFELWLREQESRLGILCTGTGACMAVRKAFFQVLSADEDVDFATPLDVIAHGGRVAFQSRAIAYDFAPTTIQGIIRSRKRMTAKNFAGTAQRLPQLLRSRCFDALWSIFSHKILRWSTPILLLFLLMSNILLFGSLLYNTFMAAQVLGYGLALLGGLTNSPNHPCLAPLRSLFSFLMANVGMLLGIVSLLHGRRISSYEKVK